ncbi:MAG: hypothetical protein WAV84_13955 [Bacteroidota bacterium]
MAQAETLDVCVEDPQLETTLLGERIMLHPESGLDFYNRGLYQTASEDLFDNFPDMGLETSRPLLVKDGDNCVLIEPGRGEISTPSFDTIQELSVVKYNSAHPTSGLFHVSVIVKNSGDPLTKPPNDSTTVLYLYLDTKEAWGKDTTFTFALPGSAFYWDTSSTAAIRDSVFEYVVGNIELRYYKLHPILYFTSVQGIPTYSIWNDTTSYFGYKLIEEFGDSTIITPLLQNFNIRISAGNSGAKFLLDAVCLTNPGTLGLIHPDLAGVLPAHQSHRGNLINRINAIVRDTSTTAEPFSNLRLLLFPEQIPRSACWITSRLGHQMLNDVSHGSVMPYMTTPSETDLNSAGTIHADFASGVYYYPISASHLRPTLNANITPVAEYYDSLTQPGKMGFVDMAMRLRTFVTKRNLYQPTLPWIPWIQNHSQLNDSLPPVYWDHMSHREPSAAELRQQCNTVLAFGARGVMFYTFASIPWRTSDPFWPPDTTTWRADTTGGSPRPLDRNMGLLGFLGDQNHPRRCDWNGEDKWDSTRNYISTFLKPIGDFMVENDLRWQTHKLWHLDGSSESIAGSNAKVRMVFSERQDLAQPRDSVQYTWVQISEFEDKAGTDYLLVLNSRTHPEGQRHVTVKLAPPPGSDYEWKVTEVRGPDSDGDIWIVRPSDTPDPSDYANGFTDYLAAGQAKLYRLETIKDETTNFSFKDGDACADRSIYVEPAAMLRLKSSDVVAFAPGNGLYCDGALRAIGTTFRPCDTEGIWEGIISRDHASAYLEGVTVNGAGVIVGSNAIDTLDEGCSIQGTAIALTNMGGAIYSNSTKSSDVSGHLLSYGNGPIQLIRDESTGSAMYSVSTAIDVGFNAQETLIDECAFASFWRGLRVEDATVRGDADNAFPSDGGNNSIRATTFGLMAMNQVRLHLRICVVKSVPLWHSRIMVRPGICLVSFSNPGQPRQRI